MQTKIMYLFILMKTGKLLFCAGLIMVLLTGIAHAETARIVDEENCLLCHRYPTMGRYDKEGNKRISYISEQEFAKSDHGKLQCTGCHVGLDRIPHSEDQIVDCSTNCHITDPSRNNQFSHADTVRKYDISVHGLKRDGITREFQDELPACKDCHDNHIYTSDKEVRQRRTQTQIVELCKMP